MVGRALGMGGRRDCQSECNHHSGYGDVRAVQNRHWGGGTIDCRRACGRLVCLGTPKG